MTSQSDRVRAAAGGHAKGYVLVGVDGSPASLAALDTAATEAAGRAVPLMIVVAQRRHGRSRTGSRPSGPSAVLEPATRTLLDDSVRRVHALAPNVEVRPDVVEEEPGAALVERSAGASLMVLGRAGHGVSGLVGTGLGSVASYVANHAHCPVLVHRGADADHPVTGGLGHRPVVVGVDGSPAAAPTLALALAEAALRGATLEVTYVWTHPPGSQPAGLHPATYSYAEARSEAERMLSEQVAGAAEAYPQLRIRPVATHSLDVARTLIDRSREAQLIVVGSRGRGGLTRLLLGSVSQALINQAFCPVLVVRPASRT
ncbi:MAG TPA: universal stress protein [Micromonosporaceae bacterium]